MTVEATIKEKPIVQSESRSKAKGITETPWQRLAVSGRPEGGRRTTRRLNARLILKYVTNLGNQISPEQDKYYDNFMRSYYKRAILTRLNVRSLDISVIGGSDNQLLSWPIILSVSGKVPVTSTQLVGRILIGIDEHATRGLTAKEIKTLLKNTKANAVGQWISIYTIDADFP
ncbi:unnamed protein product [Adineta ricciae]|uniref:Uncharacterized protein n=1 Tax=Adineta ricciae TaxID=249248 RepID=A0A815Y5H4_ADIRI|nr:unnamed protein product [Adineta ricciae]